MATREQIVATCEAYIEAVGHNDPQAVMALYGDEPILEDPVGEPPKVGRAAVQEFYEGSIVGVKMSLARVGVVTVVDHRAVFQFSIEVDLGEGNTIGLASTDVMTFDYDARIIAMTAYPDPDSWPER